MNSYKKAKSVAKDLLTKKQLQEMVLKTMGTISEIVGATLGPAGCPVLIERQEYGMPHILTKDGVTVFRHLGFKDPTAHLIMETARDAATKTVAEAGDGTTTSTVLANAIVQNTFKFINFHPQVSAQKIVRILENQFNQFIAPTIANLSIKPDEKMLYSVAKLSTNGDDKLADAVMQCFDLVGDDGNISIIEQSGPSKFEVETIKGFPISTGYEECVGGYYNLFINDRGNNRCLLDNPVFVIFNGVITSIQSIQLLMEMIADAWAHPTNYGLNKSFTPNIVLVANGFSDSVIQQLGANFSHRETVNVYPLTAPRTQSQNGQIDFLYDLAAVTGATIFDPITNTLDKATLDSLGYGISSFEASRFRSTVLGLADQDLVIMRVDEIKQGFNGSESKLDLSMLQERVGRLVGGIAKLRIFGPSSGELREKRDRAEDAICAVRGAKLHGCVPGGGWTLKQLYSILDQSREETEENEVVRLVLMPSLLEPIFRIYRNCGMTADEVEAALKGIGVNGSNLVYDAWNHKVVDAFEGQILDSTPAVLEALRASISIASLLGTLGAIVAFPRDEEMERAEAKETEAFMAAYNG